MRLVAEGRLEALAREDHLSVARDDAGGAGSRFEERPVVGVSLLADGELGGSLCDVSCDEHDASIAGAALEGPNAGLELDAHAVAARDPEAHERLGTRRDDLLEGGEQLVPIRRDDDLEEASADHARGRAAEDRKHGVAQIADATVCAELDDQVGRVANQLGLSALPLASLGWP